MNKENIKIVVCCHKECAYPKDEIYLTIQAGKAVSNVELKMHGDNEGENISSKNHDFCELTAIYWAWKNIKKLYPSTEYVGLAHYRRYLTVNKKPVSTVVHEQLSFTKQVFKLIFRHNFRFFLNQNMLYTNDKNLDKALAKTNNWYVKQINRNPETIFTTKPLKLYGLCVRDGTLFENSKERLNYVEQVIKSDWKEYSAAFDKALSAYENCYANMFVMPVKEFDEYCSFMFDVLFKVENHFDGKYDKELRETGYLGELLTNIYLVKKQDEISIKYMNGLFVR